MRELVDAKGLLKELNQKIKFYLNIESNVTYVWKYNTGTKKLADSKGTAIQGHKTCLTAKGPL